MSSSYCSSCKIELANDDTIRDHYKSEFHRYNVKRKLVDLPPVTLDQFSKKKAQLVADSSQSDRDQVLKCEPCGKTFASKATYKQHLESKKHRENLRKFNEEVKEPAKPVEEKVANGNGKTTAEDQNVCLFCNKASTDIDENLVHMRLAHSFFISEIRHLKDLQGLLRYLGTKIHKRNQCIHCGNVSNKENRSGEGVQQHMLAKGHIFMNTEDFGEYMRFYDFSKVYENFKKQGLLEDSGEEIILEEEEESFDEEEERSNKSWEVVEDEEERAKRNLKWRVKTAKVTGTGELLLPNGQIIGHRQYKNAYKQYFRPGARNGAAEGGQLEYLDENVVAAREEENRLMAINEEMMRKERNKVETQVHKYAQKKDRENLNVCMKNNKIQHIVRRSQIQTKE